MGWFHVEMPEEVRVSIIAGVVLIVGAVAAFLVKLFNVFADYWIGRVRANLADKAAHYAQQTTDGVPNNGPVPVDKLADVVQNAKEYALRMNPKQARKMNDFGDRIVARLPVEDAPGEVIKAAANAGDLAADGGQG